MIFSRLPALSLLAVSGLVPAAAMADDRPPNSEELAKIEATLSGANYTSWEEVEFDDGVWEVDDARKAGDTREYDLKIDPQTWQILSEREDY